jgi:hypothetical protein
MGRLKAAPRVPIMGRLKAAPTNLFNGRANNPAVFFSAARLLLRDTRSG